MKYIVVLRSRSMYRTQPRWVRHSDEHVIVVTTRKGYRVEDAWRDLLVLTLVLSAYDICVVNNPRSLSWRRRKVILERRAYRRMRPPRPLPRYSSSVTPDPSQSSVGTFEGERANPAHERLKQDEWLYFHFAPRAEIFRVVIAGVTSYKYRHSTEYAGQY